MAVEQAEAQGPEVEVGKQWSWLYQSWEPTCVKTSPAAIQAQSKPGC